MALFGGTSAAWPGLALVFPVVALVFGVFGSHALIFLAVALIFGSRARASWDGALLFFTARSIFP